MNVNSALARCVCSAGNVAHRLVRHPESQSAPGLAVSAGSEAPSMRAVLFYLFI